MKLVWKLVGVLIVLLAAVFIYLAFNLGQIVKDGIEHYAPPILGTSVTVAGVQLSPFSGAGSISKLAIGQPKGYGNGEAISIGKAGIALDTSSITSDVIVVKRIAIDAPTINLVQLANGNNIEALVGNIQSKAGGGAQPAKTEAQAGPSKKIIIDDFTLSNAVVSASSPLLKEGKPVELKLPDIRITGIGRKTNGARVSDAAQTIAKRIEKEVGKALTNSKEFQQQIRQKVEQEARGKIEQKLQDKLGNDNAKTLEGLLNK